MNSNVLLAFLGGAVLASGIVYMAVRPESTPKTTPVSVTTIKPAPAAEPVAQPLPQSPVVSTESPKPVESAKPSPLPPPSTAPPMAPRIRRERPVRIAQVAEVQSLPHEPVVPQRPVNDARQEPPSPAPQQAVAPAPAPPPPPVEPAPEAPPRVEVPPAPEPHTVTIPAGTVLNARIGETLSTKRNQSGDTFLATLDQPLVVDGFVIAERGARLEGRVVESDPGGRVDGVAHLGVELVKLSTADGQHVRIRTVSFAKQANTSRREDAAKIGAGAAIGAAIGAIAGGGKGAGIGAGVGGAAGAGDVLLTRGKPAEIPVETRVQFRLSDAVTLTERLN